MNEIIENKLNIKDMIYEIRGKQVMLDSDLARLYGVETKRINEAVKNNPIKFPERFSWKLSNLEYLNLKSKISTSSLNDYGGRRYNPRVFTEQGVAMLSTILKSKIAVEVSIKIMDAFVEMRTFINENKNIFNRLTIAEYKLLKHDDRINEIFDALETKKIQNEKIFFKGQIYDAYSLNIDLIKEARNRIIIIDNYIDKSVLDMLVYKKDNVEVTLITNNNYLTKLDINKFNMEYPNLKIKYLNLFHDRFMIIDNDLYHIGASLKDLGKKCFGINKIEDSIYLLLIEKNI